MKKTMSLIALLSLVALASCGQEVVETTEITPDTVVVEQPAMEEVMADEPAMEEVMADEPAMADEAMMEDEATAE